MDIAEVGTVRLATRPRRDREKLLDRIIESLDVQWNAEDTDPLPLTGIKAGNGVAVARWSPSFVHYSFESSVARSPFGKTSSAPSTVQSTMLRPSASNARLAMLYAIAEVSKSGNCHLKPLPK